MATRTKNAKQWRESTPHSGTKHESRTTGTAVQVAEVCVVSYRWHNLNKTTKRESPLAVTDTGIGKPHEVATAKIHSTCTWQRVVATVWESSDFWWCLLIWRRIYCACVTSQAPICCTSATLQPLQRTRLSSGKHPFPSFSDVKRMLHICNEGSTCKMQVYSNGMDSTECSIW